MAKLRKQRQIAEGEKCECCGLHPPKHVHEITAGAHRHRALTDNNAQLRVCESCHKELQGIPYAEQIASKVLTMVGAVNRCAGRAAVTPAQVARLIEGGE